MTRDDLALLAFLLGLAALVAVCTVVVGHLAVLHAPLGLLMEGRT
jgi:hypothetical protein